MPSARPNLLSFLIELDGKGALPGRVWRRIHLPTSATIDNLHLAIQLAFGWSNTHLYEMQIGTRTFVDGQAEDRRDGFATEVALADGFRRPGARGTYLYDFGDGWTHSVTYEGRRRARASSAYPMLVAGAGACPPEDSGGSHGWSRLREQRGSAWWVGTRIDTDPCALTATLPIHGVEALITGSELGSQEP